MILTGIEMTKTQSIDTVISLHQELLNACSQYEHYLNLNDVNMAQLWYQQMLLLTEEMEDL